jgi:hypothetical protein
VTGHLLQNTITDLVTSRSSKATLHVPPVSALSISITRQFADEPRRVADAHLGCVGSDSSAKHGRYG